MWAVEGRLRSFRSFCFLFSAFFIFADFLPICVLKPCLDFPYILVFLKKTEKNTMSRHTSVQYVPSW